MTGVLPVLDPLAPGEPGEYRDELVRVVRLGDGQPRTSLGPVLARTRNFRLHDGGSRVEVSHVLRRPDLGNDLTELLAGELFRPGVLAGSALFERIFVGVVRSTVPGALPAWRAFYGNTLARLRSRPRGRSWTADLAPVYDRAAALVPPGRVLDLGSCFGFFPLLLAGRDGYEVTASDLVPGSMRLLSAVAASEGVPLRTIACDAAAVPLPDGAADTVTVLHLLEHLAPAEGALVLAEALRLAARRVVVAVPFEDEPSTWYGHVRRFGREELAALGEGTGLPFTVSEHHGGWLTVHVA
ncbi:mycofactocin oligosaccharide methyltransferase MftM [Prauserella flavalba]|uniref:Methyltransferase type 11 domain-containing protein n=1 Tax=Prauserella flavalba TaxID=1477506 RepID=A0A318LDA2_9PSEU|nr:mycofactocin oligosaccharide methyltransferase MftM [Prauserella flavalba]PXY23974.1 hypothetical protein BA062_27275 [Prauserella flavalba]